MPHPSLTRLGDLAESTHRSRCNHSSKPHPWRKRKWAVALVVLAMLAGGLLSTKALLSAPPTDQDLADRFKIPVEVVGQLHTERAMSAESLAAFPLDKLPRIMQRLSSPNLPREREAFAALRDRNEKGVIPIGARAQAILQLNKMRQAAPASGKVAGLPVLVRVIPGELFPLTAGLDRKGSLSARAMSAAGRAPSLFTRPNRTSSGWVAWEAASGRALTEAKSSRPSMIS
jgi:hypothetical protein